jgi:excisionase family DNA binding protein
MATLEPIAPSPREAAQFLSISKRTLSRLIARRKIVARKDGVRTLVDVASLKAYYEALPLKSHHAPLVFGCRAHVVPCSRRMARR